MFEVVVLFLGVVVAYLVVRKGGFGVTPCSPITPTPKEPDDVS